MSPAFPFCVCDYKRKPHQFERGHCTPVPPPTVAPKGPSGVSRPPAVRVIIEVAR